MFECLALCVLPALLMMTMLHILCIEPCYGMIKFMAISPHGASQFNCMAMAGGRRNGCGWRGTCHRLGLGLGPGLDLGSGSASGSGSGSGYGLVLRKENDLCHVGVGTVAF